MDKVAIIVSTYNPEKYLKALFRSLDDLNYLKDDFKVFVINDNPKSSIKDKIFKVKGDLNLDVVENEKNLGFAGGNNVGMRLSLKEKYEYIILLNQDMEVDENWLAELVKKAELVVDTKDAKNAKLQKCESCENTKIGVVQSMMLFYKSRDIIYSTGDRLNYLGIGYSGNFQFPISNFSVRGGPSSGWQFSKNIISYAGGAAVLFKREVLEKVGLFDESFFMYHEDSDLSWRTRMAGYDIALAEKAICYHDYQFKRNKRVFYWTEKNRLAFLLKNFEFRTLILIFPMFVVMEFGMMFYALATGWLPEKLRAYGWFLKNLRQILKKRRIIQKDRKVSDKELKQYLVAEIEFSGLENPALKYVANPMLKLYWGVIKRFI